MKVHFEVDMTPEEARAVMGLPDVAPMQKQMLADMQARAKAAYESGDIEAMMKVWMPFAGTNGVKAFEQFQKLLWDSASTVAGSAGRKTKP
jgi:hypothetical protein